MGLRWDAGNVLVGELIRARRNELGLTQEDVADLLGKDQNYVSFVETGRIKRPARAVLQAFSRILMMHIGDLYRAADYAPDEDEGVTLKGDTIPVQDWGYVPADAVRWVESVQRGVYLDVPLRFAYGHSADELIVLHASGNCLATRGIADGSVVVCERANGREPRNGKIVAVRVGDERSLKVWHKVGDVIQLYDGDGNVAATLSTADDIDVVGFFLASWYEESAE